MHALAQHRAWLGDDRALDHAGVAGHDGFHLRGIDFQAAAVDHVLLAIEHAHEVFLTDRAEIAGVPEAAGKALRRRLRIIPVAADDGGRANPDLADLAARQFAAIAVH